MTADDDIIANVRKLDERVRRLEQKSAADHERYNAFTSRIDKLETDMTRRFDSIDLQFSKISKNVSWGVKLVVGGLVTAILSYIIAGGLAV